MYSAMSQTISAYETNIGKRSQSASSTAMGAELDTVQGDKGYSLLTTSHMQLVSTQIARYKQLGVQSVMLAIGFPTLCPQFFQSIGAADDFTKFSNFYQQVIQQCHAAGMQVLVESHPLFPSPSSSAVFSQQASKFTRLLSAANFQKYMAAHNASIAALNPDCISIVAEPNTDVAWTGQAAYNSPSAMATLVGASASAISAVSSKILVAAGAPSWMTKAQEFDTALYAVNGLGAIDIHTYFTGANDLVTATSLADQAHANGKQVVVSECWPSKAGSGTPPSAPIGLGQATLSRAVSSFSFWQPLDAIYIYLWFIWCNVENPQIFCFSYSNLLFAYLNYSQVRSLSDAQIILDAQAAANQATVSGQPSSTGLYYSKLLTAPRQSHY
jgi:hypothetical protein